MWTIIYKQYFIHGYCDKPQCRVQAPGMTTIEFKSLHAAKIAITKRSSPCKPKSL